MIRVENWSENGWLLNIVMGYGIRTYIFQKLLDLAASPRRCRFICEQMTRVDKASQFCLIPVYVLHVILLNETIWLKLACIAVAL